MHSSADVDGSKSELWQPRYTFWTDVISMLSVPLDFSVVADNFVGLFEDAPDCQMPAEPQHQA